MLLSKHIFTLLALVLLLQINAAAQLPDYHVKVLTEQQGLTTADILSIAKDKNGFLWLVSQTAVQRYDGRQAKKFAVNETAQQIFIDSKDRKWLLTRNSVHRFENDYTGFVTVPVISKVGNSPICLFNAKGALFLVLSGSIQQYDEAQKKFIPSTAFPLQITKPLAGIHATGKYFIFLSSGDSIYSIDIISRRCHSIPFKGTLSALITLSDNQVLVSDFNSRTYRINLGLQTIEEIRASRITKNPNIKFLRLYAGTEFNKNIFLLASNLGFIQYDISSDSFSLPVFYVRGQLLINNQATRCFYKDVEGTIYMSHADGMAFFSPHSSPIHYLRNYNNGGDGLPDIDIRSFAEDAEKNIWIATVNGIARLNMQNGIIKSFTPDNNKQGINYPSVRHLLFDDGILWVATGGKGVWLYNTSTGEFSRPKFSNDSIGRRTMELMNEDFIWKLIKLQNGNILAVSGGRTYSINPKNFTITQAAVPLAGVSRSAILDSSNRIWVGGTKGLSCSNANFQLQFSVQDSFPDKRIAALLEWKMNNVLIGTKGLFEIVTDKYRVTQFKRIDAIPATRFIYCMEKDSDGIVWMGTDEGLYKYNPTTGKAELFDAKDNIQPQSFNSNGLFYSVSGLLFAGGKTGFNYFNPSTIRKNQTSLLPGISSFTIGNDDSSFFLRPQPYKIPYFNQGFSFTITTPEYNNPYTIQYRYRVKKNSNDWLSNGNNNIVLLHNLSSGSYDFSVSATYDGINWYNSNQSIQIIILKPWWQQWWFRVLCTVIIGVVAWFIINYRKRKRIDKEYQRTIDYFANSGYEHSSTEDILWDISRNCISRLGFEDCVIYLMDEQRQMLVQKAAYGAKNTKTFEIINPIEIPVGKAIVGHVAATGNAEIIADTTKDNRYLLDDEARLSEITVPIIHQGNVIGIIDSENKKKGFFTKKHLQTLQRIASICSAKISRSMAVAEMKKAEKQLNLLNSKMLETKFMNLRLQMNPHFLFNSLSSIQHLIVSQQTNEAYKYLSVFSNFLRSVLQYADKTVIKLDEELKMLEMYVKLELLGSDKTFEYSIEVDEQLEPEDILIPPLLIQPVVENAIWHGLMHKEGKKTLSVSFRDSGDEHLICTVDDNGIGRIAASAIGQKNLNNFAYQSKSTQLIKERLQLLKEKTGKQASIKVEDKSINGVSEGTRIKMIIPFYNIDEI